MKIALMIVLVVAANAAKLFDFDPRGRQLNQGPEVHVLIDERQGPVEAEFSHVLELSDGTRIDESGTAGSAGQSNKQGSYSFTDPDGVFVEVQWIADENGFQPVGASIPELPAHVHDLLRIAEQQRADGIQFDQQGFRINK